MAESLQCRVSLGKAGHFDACIHSLDLTGASWAPDVGQIIVNQGPLMAPASVSTWTKTDTDMDHITMLQRTKAKAGSVVLSLAACSCNSSPWQAETGGLKV